MIKYFSLFLLSAVFIFSSATFVLAVPLDSPNTITDDTSLLSIFGKSAGFDTGNNDGTQLGEIVAKIIEAFLGLLGIIFIILILYAGYSWMTAGGDEQKVTKAKDTIQKAIIGLVVIVAAYSITYFVFNALPWGDGTGGGIPTGGSNPL